MNTEFVPPGHFYSVIPNIDLKLCKYDASLPKFIELEFNDENHNKVLNELPSILNNFDSLFGHSQDVIKIRSDAGKYSLMNGAFEWMDARLLYYMIKTKSPSKIIEIGSGHSTLLMSNTIEYFNMHTKILSIEPYPMDFLKALNDNRAISLITDKLENIDCSIFKSLEENDLLFIDSSHVGKYNSDVLYYFTRIFPILKKGVFIHIHDIFFPYDYPFDWFKEGRYWNEQYYLFMFLQFNSKFKIYYCNSYSEYKFKSHLEEIQHSSFERITNITSNVFSGGSIWLEVVE